MKVCSVDVLGFEAVDWHCLINDVKHNTRPLVNDEPAPLLLVEGTMVLNYRFSVILYYVNIMLN